MLPLPDWPIWGFGSRLEGFTFPANPLVICESNVGFLAHQIFPPVLLVRIFDCVLCVPLGVSLV